MFAQDLDAAVERIKRAKHEVGRKRTWPAAQTTTREVTPAEVPEAFRAEAEKGDANG